MRKNFLRKGAIKYCIIFIFMILLIVFLITRLTPDAENEVQDELSNNTSTLNEEVNIDIVEETLDNSSEDLYFFISDCYGSDGYPSSEEFFSADDSLERLKHWNFLLHEEFDFHEFSPQSLHYIGSFEGEEKFILSYNGIDADYRNQVGIGFYGEEITATPLKSVFLGDTFDFENAISEGRYFNPNDYNITDVNQEISVILGAEYQGIYELNDTIELSLMQRNLTFRVIGFFEENTSMERTTLLFSDIPEVFSFDQSIILPFYQINYEPVDELDDYYQKRYYFIKNCGHILCEDGLDYEAYIDIVNEKNEELAELGFTYTLPYEYEYYSEKVIELSKQLDLFYIVSISPIRFQW